MKQKQAILILALIAVVLVVASCTPKPSIIPPAGGAGDTQELKKFGSVAELREFLKDAQDYSGNGYMIKSAVSGMFRESLSVAPTAAMDMAVSGGGAIDYSQTNIQVAGVDEADFVKNDNKYIYTLSNNKLVIVDAFPANEAKVVSETVIDGTPQQLFVGQNRLVVFTQDYEEVYRISEYDFIPRPTSTSLTHAVVYDITDREKPKKLFDYNIPGNYYQSRMIGDYVYFIVNDYVRYQPLYLDTPVIKETKKTLIRPDIYYFDNPESSYNFNTVAAFNMQGDEESIEAKTFMMGYSTTLYVSENNIYLAYQKNPPYISYQQNEEESFFTVVVPLLPSDVQDRINKIKNDNSLNSYETWDKISSELEDMYNNMDKAEKEDLVTKIEKAKAEYDQKIEIEQRKTVIHKIGIDKGYIEYKAKGEVPGYLHDQFSMDENDGNLRVATSVQLWTRQGDSASFNNVYVLDKNMKNIGALEGLAEGETIYSTRFVGDRLYMVTFKRIDPLFVIDLSDPENPEVLGKLKIPGYSDYLHPYDETHIIGIGKETEANEWGGVSTSSLKLALFDVSDVEHPTQLAKYEIGTEGTDSEALNDHKAFLFDKKKNLLVIPVREVKDRPHSTEGYWTWNVWQGAYVFGLTIEDGFELKGKISHRDSSLEESSWYYSSPWAVRRSLFMDDVLYTVSDKLIKMNSLDDIQDEIGAVKLPYNETYYPRPYY